MSMISKELLKQTNDWVAAVSGSLDRSSSGGDTVGAELKGKWLQVIDEMKKGENGEAVSKLVSGIEKNQDAIREEIGRLVYEGRINDDSVMSVLKGSIDLNAMDNASKICGLCAACSSCAICGTCALCCISGVVTAISAAAIGTTGVTATIS